MNKVQITIGLTGFMSLLETEIRKYDIGEDRVNLFLAMNKHFCEDGIGGTGTCETIEDYVREFVYNSVWGYFNDWGDDFESEEAKLEDIYNNCLYVDEDLKMFVEFF